MEPYKILFDRPTAGSFAAEKRMDFDALVSRAIRAKRHALIRNTAAITLAASAALFATLYFLSGQQHPRQESRPAVIADSVKRPLKDSTAATPTPKPAQMARHQQPLPGKDQLVTKSANKEPSPREDSFKIQESLLPVPNFVPAEPLCGLDSLNTYLKKRLIYPQKIAAQRIEGTVVVSFTITKNGTVSDVAVVKGIQSTIDSIALQAVKAMPLWAPAQSNGTPVESRHTIPLDFRVERK